MSNVLEIRLTPEQLDELALKIAASMSGIKPDAVPGQTEAAPSEFLPIYTPTEAAKVLGFCEKTIRRYVQAGLIKRVPGFSKLRIPGAEIKRLSQGGHV